MQVMEIERVDMKNKRTRMGNGKRWNWEMEKRWSWEMEKRWNWEIEMREYRTR